jgi:nitroreductase
LAASSSSWPWRATSASASGRERVAVQNIILACRDLGLGTVLTTKEPLGIPDDAASFAPMPLGRPLQNFSPLTRNPVREAAFAGRWSEAGGLKRSGEGQSLACPVEPHPWNLGASGVYP